MAIPTTPHTQTRQNLDTTGDDLDPNQNIQDLAKPEETELYANSDGAQSGGTRAFNANDLRGHRHRVVPEDSALTGSVSTRTPGSDRQGITNHSASEESARQRKVVSQRPDAQAGVDQTGLARSNVSFRAGPNRSSTMSLPVLLARPLDHHWRFAQFAWRHPMPQVRLRLGVGMRTLPRMRRVRPLMAAGLRHRHRIGALSFRRVPVRIFHRLLHRIAVFLHRFLLRLRMFLCHRISSIGLKTASDARRVTREIAASLNPLNPLTADLLTR